MSPDGAEARIRTLELELARTERELEKAQSKNRFSLRNVNLWILVVYLVTAVGFARDGRWAMSSLWLVLGILLPMGNLAPRSYKDRLGEEITHRSRMIEEIAAGHPDVQPLSPLARAELLPARTWAAPESRTAIWSLLGLMVVLVFVALQLGSAEQSTASLLALLGAGGAGLGAAVAGFRAHIRGLTEAGTDFALRRARLPGDDEPSTPTST